MARKVIFSSGTDTGKFSDQLATIEREVVDANIPAARKLVGRTAEALYKLRTQAKSEGFDSGYSDGFASGQKAAIQEVMEQLEASVTEFGETLQAKSDQVFFAAQAWAEQSEKQLAELAVLIASRILGQEIRLGHDVITEIAKAAIQEVQLADSIRVRINPFDSQTVASNKASLLALNPHLRSIEVVEDPSIIGGCLIESDGGIVDATIQTKVILMLEAIREAA